MNENILLHFLTHVQTHKTHKNIYLQRNLESLSPLTLNCDTPSMNSVKNIQQSHRLSVTIEITKVLLKPSKKCSTIQLYIHISENASCQVASVSWVICLFTFSSWYWHHYDVIAIFCFLHYSCLSEEHSIEQCTIYASIEQRYSQFKTRICAECRQTLWTQHKLICVEKQRNGIPHEHLPQLLVNVFHHFKLN